MVEAEIEHRLLFNIGIKSHYLLENIMFCVRAM